MVNGEGMLELDTAVPVKEGVAGVNVEEAGSAASFVTSGD